MIQKIQNFFHTDTWWGKTIFVTAAYIVFWLVFYGLVFLIPDSFFEFNNIPGSVTLIYALLIVPLVSLFLVRFIRKYVVIKKTNLYIIHGLYIVLSILLFLVVLVLGALKNYSGF